MLVSGKRLTVLGPGADSITISSGAIDSNIHVSKDATLDISGLSFKDNQTMGNAFLFNEGTLTATDSIISGNKTTSGRISYGGGIENRGTLTVKSSIISNNSASSQGFGEGGGIFNTGTLTVTNSTISGNTAIGSDSGGYGGGIFNYDQGTLTVTGSTISNNSANGKQDKPGGGGILSEGTLTLINSTVSGNSAFADGGGILIQTIISDQQPVIAQADLTFSTIYGNRAASGADIAVEDFTSSSNGTLTSTQQQSQVKIRNSIVVSDPAQPGPNIAGTLTSDGYNLIQDSSAANFAPNPQHSTDVSVDPQTDLKIDSLLRDGGGLTTPHTFIHALLPGSPAINKIPLAACHPQGISTDQRGMKRPGENGSACDIGAYEASYKG